MMTVSERIKRLFERSRAIASNPPQSSFTRDLHASARTTYQDLPRWEKQARAMAYAVTHQQIWIDPEDHIIGRVYYKNELPVTEYDPDFDFNTQPRLDAQQNDPAYAELCRYALATYGSPGHIAWDWNTVLRHGTDGIRQRCKAERQKHSDDEKALRFYNGVLIMLDALEEWNEQHVRRLLEMGKDEEAAICRRVPKYPAQSFREAVQAFFMQFIIVMKENPYGGNSPGRLDYYLWPYLEKDLADKVITLEEAEELIEELFIRIDERMFHNDMWVESVVVGGSDPSGASAVNPLTYIMIRAFMKHDITHPHIYCRIPNDPPKEYIDLLADYVIHGNNRAQLLCDEAIIKALRTNGVSETDAVDYFCGGCMEIGVQGKTSDFLFTGYVNISKMLELCITGGYCLIGKKALDHLSPTPLTEFACFEDFYASFKRESARILTENLRYQDRLSAYVEEMRPAYLISSMIDDCIATGRNMHGGGARYHDYGTSFVGVPNTADSLFAIKKAVFDEKICTAHELIDALKADFAGYEALRQRLLSLPKFGQGDPEADAMASRLCRDLSEVYSGYVNRFGGGGKPVMLTFIWAPTAGAMLGATPDGRHAGVPVAHSVTPQSMAMTKGITTAINSCCTLPFELFSGGASTMWDLSPSIAKPEIVSALFMSFFEGGGHIFQGNVTDVEQLRRALENPEQYGHLIVRVGGYSARFVTLKRELQEEIIGRIRHSC